MELQPYKKFLTPEQIEYFIEYSEGIYNQEFRNKFIELQKKYAINGQTFNNIRQNNIQIMWDYVKNKLETTNKYYKELKERNEEDTINKLIVATLESSTYSNDWNFVKSFEIQNKIDRINRDAKQIIREYEAFHENLHLIENFKKYWNSFSKENVSKEYMKIIDNIHSIIKPLINELEKQFPEKKFAIKTIISNYIMAECDIQQLLNFCYDNDLWGLIEQTKINEQIEKQKKENIKRLDVIQKQIVIENSKQKQLVELWLKKAISADLYQSTKNGIDTTINELNAQYNSIKNELN